MPHSFGCKSTDWLRGISSSFKKFTFGVNVIFDGASIVQMLKGVGVSTVQLSSIRTTFLKCNIIFTFCAIDQVDLVCDTCKADSIKASTKEK